MGVTLLPEGPVYFVNFGAKLRKYRNFKMSMKKVTYIALTSCDIIAICIAIVRLVLR